MTVAPAAVAVHPAVVRLGTLDRLLPLWILLAMALGLLIGRVAPGVAPALDSAKVSGVSLPIAVGLFLMMYPVLARVRYSDLGRLGRRSRLFTVSLLLNWVVGPLLMFALAWAFLPDLPDYRTGLILIGLARCIAMVLIWNMLARGSGEVAAVLVALNSLFQIALLLGAGLVLPLRGARLVRRGRGRRCTIAVWAIARNVLVFLGAPAAGGGAHAPAWCELTADARGTSRRFLPRLGPIALFAPALHHRPHVRAAGGQHQPAAAGRGPHRAPAPRLLRGDVHRLLPPLAGSSASPTRRPRPCPSPRRETTSSWPSRWRSATFGLSSGEALAGVVGPLIEVPALVSLVYLSLWLRGRLFVAEPVPSPLARPQES